MSDDPPLPKPHKAITITSTDLSSGEDDEEWEDDDEVDEDEGDEEDDESEDESGEQVREAIPAFPDDDDDIQILESPPPEPPRTTRARAAAAARKKDKGKAPAHKTVKVSAQPSVPAASGSSKVAGSSKTSKGKKKEERPSSPVPFSSRGINSALPPNQRTLSDRALEVYEGLMPSSVFTTHPEAARMLFSRPENAPEVREPSLFFPTQTNSLLATTPLPPQDLPPQSSSLCPFEKEEVQEV